MSLTCGRWAFATYSEPFTNENEHGYTYTLVTFLTSVKDDVKSNRIEDVIAIGAGQTVTLNLNVPNGCTGTIRLFQRDYELDGTFVGTKVLDVTSDSPFCPMGPR